MEPFSTVQDPIAPFKDWVLPAAMERVRRKLAGAADGNRQMVDILTAVLTDRLRSNNPRSLRLRNPGQLRRRERYRQKPSLKGV
jgi:hypothetical protein